MRTVALIDADVVVYQKALAAEQAIHWGNDMWTLHCDFNEVQQRVDGFLEDMQEALQADDMILALSCPSDQVFRKRILSSYKENRVGRRKPVVWGPLRDYLCENYNAVLRKNLEASWNLGTAGEHLTVYLDSHLLAETLTLWRTLRLHACCHDVVPRTDQS